MASQLRLRKKRSCWPDSSFFDCSARRHAGTRRPRLCGRALSGRRLGGFTASSSSDGLCDLNPSRRSRCALLRIAQRGRCNRSTGSDTECVGHKVNSSRSSSSVQRDIAASVMEAPQRYASCLQIRVATSAIAFFRHGKNIVGNRSAECSKVNSLPMVATAFLAAHDLDQYPVFGIWRRARGGQQAGSLMWVNSRN